VAPRTPARLDAGSVVAALGGVLLLISLFLNWYGAVDGDEGVSAWNSFELVDILLALLALTAILAPLAHLPGDRAPRVAPALISAAGPIALALVVISIIDTPPILLYVPDSDLETGAWLALAASALMTIGSLLGRVRISFVVASREPVGRDGRGGAGEPATSADPAAETRVMREGTKPPGI
jgi:hypothetical protein